ncbi:tol-pal system protein YbgF [Aquibium oceanicum]|uniref:Cell division coordinator CpoB n=1 Tax=Aquibium oceanicum TaxID=1670800 RepID=A0A1L3SXZ9_9HYPH|nr:tol-pal system protein YbgF [Aquibium oceanicum]APH74241.1 tol-pal system protein YbgF [Aquibium oceanicum]
MKSTTIFCAALSLPLLVGSMAVAAPLNNPSPADGGTLQRLLPQNWLRQPGEAPRVQLAQAGDPRVVQLEEQIRQLNGKIEELNFLLLQTQDQIRKMQEDNEFRLQQLEEKQGAVSVRPSEDTASNASGGTDTLAGAQAPGAAQPAGEMPKTLGTITFDANGNSVGGSAGGGEEDTAFAEGGSQVPGGGTTDGTQVAALPATDSPDELYRNAYNFILSGDYATAEAGFREHIERFPDDPKAADANYWLGEALLGMQEYRQAAEVFLAANQSYPNSGKSPDMLLKLGVSLAALNQRDVACATYAEIGNRYRDVSAALKERVKAEQALAGC